ncbi:hypothetical protein Scep_009447 [Stephania cephalantha]|uniref:Secreted protein n=1 Tax=Stephania cephalantha TaxID=152367 RepID=A0AAP0PGA4_9MAGN
MLYFFPLFFAGVGLPSQTPCGVRMQGRLLPCIPRARMNCHGSSSEFVNSNPQQRPTETTTTNDTTTHLVFTFVELSVSLSRSFPLSLSRSLFLLLLPFSLVRHCFFFFE